MDKANTNAKSVLDKHEEEKAAQEDKFLKKLKYENARTKTTIIEKRER